MKMMKLLITALSLMFGAQIAMAQQNTLEPVGLGETMGDFTLTSYQGDEVRLSDLDGKNVLLIFPRGKVLPNMWCPLCYYQYAEIAELEAKHGLRDKYDLEILYILPYPKDSITAWRKAAFNGLQTIENWKYPDGYDTLTGGVKRWAEYVREFFPQKFTYPDGEFDLPLPVLMDEDKEVSKALFLFTEEWGGTKAEQNMPTVFLLDKDKVVRFKYHSQYTNDRPTAEYIVEYIRKML
jgi:peroxiredoxin